MSIRQNPSVRLSGRARVVIGAATVRDAQLFPITACSDDSDRSAESVEPTVSISAPPATATVPTASATPITAERELAIGQFCGTGDERPLRRSAGLGGDEALVRLVDSERDVAGAHNVAVRFLDVANIYTDPSQWSRFDPPVGPTVDDLVSALQQVPAFDVTPRDVTVDGFDGKYVEFTFDPYDEAVCRDGRFGLWDDAGPQPDGRAALVGAGSRADDPCVDRRRRRDTARDRRLLPPGDPGPEPSRDRRDRRLDPDRLTTPIVGHHGRAIARLDNNQPPPTTGGSR